MSERKPVSELTWEDIRKMGGAEYRQLLGHAEGKAKVDEILAAEKAKKDAVEAAAKAAATAAVESTPEEKAAAEAAAAAAAVPTPEEMAAAELVRVATEKAAADEAEAARVLAEANAKAAREAEAQPKRFVIDFQATDEARNPIGNKTHLEAASQEELIEKMKTSYLNAVRAIDRLKKQKPTFKKEEVVQVSTQEELDAAAADLVSDDPAIRAAAVRKLASAEVEKDRAEARLEKENARQAQCSFTFLKNHLTDYNNCQANNEMLEQFLKENNLSWTTENLEIALNNLESQLAPPVIRQVAPEAPAARVVDNPSAAAAPAVPVVAPAGPAATPAPVVPAAAVPAAPVPPVAPAANPAPAAPARRPGVNGGVIPGETLTGARPVAQEPKLTKKDIAKMTPDEMRRRQKIDRTFYDQVNALFAKKA